MKAARPRRSRAVIFGWTLVPLGLLAAWQLAAYLAGSWLFPPPTTVAERLFHPTRDLYHSGSLLSNTLVSLVRVLIGFALAAVAGVALGLLMGVARTVRALIEPTVEILRPLCPIAWLPFAIAVFGLKTLPQFFGVRYSRTIFDQVQLGMLFVLFWGAFFPVLINTLDGVIRVRRNYVLLAKMLGAGKRGAFLHVYLPAASPSILTGLRQGIGTCWFVIIAAEMLPGIQSGIGYLLMYASDQAAMDVVIAAMIIIGTVGAFLNFLVLAACGTLVRWKGKEY